MYTSKKKTGCPLRCLLEIMSHFQSHFCVHYLYILINYYILKWFWKVTFTLKSASRLRHVQTCTVSYTSLKWKSKWLQAYDRYDVTNQMLCVLCCQRIIQFNYCIYTCLVFVIVSFLLFYYLNIWRVKLLNLSFFKDIYMFSVVKESFI